MASKGRSKEIDYGYAIQTVSISIVGLWIVIAVYMLAAYPHQLEKKPGDIFLVAGFIVPFLVSTVFFNINIRYPRTIITLSLIFTAFYVFWFELPLLLIIGCLMILIWANIFSWMQFNPPKNKYLNWIGTHFGELLIFIWILFWAFSYFDMFHFNRLHFDYFDD